jgi:hypothetical protein
VVECLFFKLPFIVNAGMTDVENAAEIIAAIEAVKTSAEGEKAIAEELAKYMGAWTDIETVASQLLQSFSVRLSHHANTAVRSAITTLTSKYHSTNQRVTGTSYCVCSCLCTMYGDRNRFEMLTGLEDTVYSCLPSSGARNHAHLLPVQPFQVVL